MKILWVALIILLVGLQYQFWFSAGGVLSAWRMQHQLHQVVVKNQKLQQKNLRLIADIKDLKQGHEAVEERARRDLGMIKSNEVFYQVEDK